MNRILWALLMVATGCVFLQGCDLLTDFPLILNGSVESQTIPLDVTPIPVPFQDSISVNLSDVKNAASSDVDSVKFYNLTVRIDSNSTPNSTMTGAISVHGDTIVTFTNMKTSVFSTERSIFSTSISGWKYNAVGVEDLVQALHETPAPTVTLKLTLEPVSQAIHCRVHIKVYGQLFVKNK